MAKQTGLSGWGRTFVPGREVRSENLPAITRQAVLSRGLGRSYGDASLPPSGTLEVVGTTLADRILGFDADTGVLRAEAGLVLSDMNRLFLPRGFFTPVTPGTRFVTLGGMVASDVHGKNHHVDGTIGRHVQRILLALPNGRTVECSREHEPELFYATLGGMGLTGHILEVQLKLARVPSPWIHRESYRYGDLDTLLQKLKEAGKEWPFTVAWIDTVATGKSLGRGILYCGRWAEQSEAPNKLPTPQRQKLAMPFALPSGLLNRFTVGLFNQLVYGAHYQAHKQDICDPDTFFYPLDSVRQWNLAYGERGVTQHQSVIPEEAGPAGVRGLIDVLAQTGSCSFLSVVKDCGPEGEGMLSFPRPGMSLALDIPITSNTQEVIDRLNKHVLDCGGRIYLTKDGFTRREHFRAMEPRLARFWAVKEKWDPERKIHSALSDRLLEPGYAQDDSVDEEEVERRSAAFARAEIEREERARAAQPPPEAARNTTPELGAVPPAVAPLSEPSSTPTQPEFAAAPRSEPAFGTRQERTLMGMVPPSNPAPAPTSEPAPAAGSAPAAVSPAAAAEPMAAEPVAAEPVAAEPVAEDESTVEPELVVDAPIVSVPPPVPPSARPPAGSMPPPSARLSIPALDPGALPKRLSIPAPRPSIPPPSAPAASAPPASAPPAARPSERPVPSFGKATLVGMPALSTPPPPPPDPENNADEDDKA
jgi:decaprenylphospho-beta-D-ribofuranose 2-oxidase